MVFTEKELADKLFEEAQAVNAKINELKQDFDLFKFQDSERANYVAIQIRALETYLEVLNSRINFEVGVAEGESYSPDASYVCSREDCVGCKYDPDMCPFDSDRSCTEFEEVILDKVDDDYEDEDEFDEENCDGDCENCPYAEENDEEDDKDDIFYGVSVEKNGDNVVLKTTPNISEEELNYVLDKMIKVVGGDAELIKRELKPEPKAEPKKIVIKKKKNEDKK